MTTPRSNKDKITKAFNEIWNPRHAFFINRVARVSYKISFRLIDQ